MTSDSDIDKLLKAAKNNQPPRPPDDLVARVLADAATHAPALPAAALLPAHPVFWRRVLAPVGGIGGGLVLATCAALGIFIGADFSDTLYNIPVVEQMIASFTNSTDATSPFETLSQLMAES